MKPKVIVGTFFAIVSLCLGDPSVGVAQTNATPEAQTSMAVPDAGILLVRPRWAIGAQFGIISGVGIGARYHSAGRLVLQAVAGGYKIGESRALSFGGELQFDFDVMENSRFYGIACAGFHSFKTDSHQEHLDAPFRCGLGAGYEYTLSDKVVLSGSLILAYYTKTGDFYPLIPQIGLFYNFR